MIARCAFALLLAGCLRPADDRVDRELAIGDATGAGARVVAADGLAHVRAIEAGAIELWLQAPAVELTIAVEPAAAGDWTVTAGNALADAALIATADGQPVPVVALGGPRPTVRGWRLSLPAGTTAVRIAPPDEADLAPWRFAVMGDIQDALPDVHDVFARIDAEPGLRFVLSTGDIVHRGRVEEWTLFEQQLETLDLPFYSTIGNHELWGNDVDQWYRRFGRANVHFRFRGVAMTLVDSASATIDPTVDRWLDDWLADAAGDLHVFGTHYPPIDPVGVRQGSFASRREGEALLARLAGAGVDLTVYGHLHTYIGFENAGIPAHVSGGGGAEPMRLDGIGRHFLVVDAEPASQRLAPARVVRVD